MLNSTVWFVLCQLIMFYKESLCYTAPLMYSFSIAISTTIFAYHHYTRWGSCIGKDILILSTNMVSRLDCDSTNMVSRLDCDSTNMVSRLDCDSTNMVSRLDCDSLYLTFCNFILSYFMLHLFGIDWVLKFVYLLWVLFGLHCDALSGLWCFVYLYYVALCCLSGLCCSVYLNWDFFLSVWIVVFFLSRLWCFVYLDWYVLSIWIDMFCLSGLICFVYLEWYVLSI